MLSVYVMQLEVVLAGKGGPSLGPVLTQQSLPRLSISSAPCSLFHFIYFFFKDLFIFIYIGVLLACVSV